MLNEAFDVWYSAHMKIVRDFCTKVGIRLTITTLVYLALSVVLMLTAGVSLVQGNWESSLLAITTIAFLFAPFLIEQKMNVYFPTLFSFFISLFLIATIILGEFGEYYAKYWWWDVMLHSGSGIAFGLIGLVVLLIFLRRGKIEAKAYVLCFFAFCFALAIGLLWEVVEFASDQLLGTNMQNTQTGVVDTMKDLCMDTLGALMGAALGYLYLHKDISTPLDRTIDEAIQKNRVA